MLFLNRFQLFAKDVPKQLFHLFQSHPKLKLQKLLQQYFLLENYTAQVELKPGYYDLFGIKLICVVAAFFLSIYQTFNLRARIANLDLSPENRKFVPKTVQQIKKTTTPILIAFSLAAFFGIWLARF